MPLSENQTTQLAIFRTKPIGPDGQFVLGWQQLFQSIIQFMANSPQVSRLTHAQRLSLNTANVNIGSIVFETDTPHVDIWDGTAWVQLV